MAKQSRTNADGAQTGTKEQPTTPSGSQTLLRGLDVIEAISHGRLPLPDLAGTLGLTRSTSHRLASVLCERGYLKFSPREGYTLGPKLLELGYLAQQALDIPRLARPHIEELSFQTDDTVHLGVMDDGEALYMDKIAGRRPGRHQLDQRAGRRRDADLLYADQGGGPSLMQSCAIALGPYGIRCNSVLPGTIETAINKDDLAAAEKRRHMAGRIPLGRLGEPEDCVGPTVFLASDLARYVTGAALLVDGGMYVNLQ